MRAEHYGLPHDQLLAAHGLPSRVESDAGGRSKKRAVGSGEIDGPRQGQGVKAGGPRGHEPQVESYIRVDVASATLVVYAFTSPRSDGHLPFRQGVRLRCNHMRSWNWWQNCHRNLRKNCGAELGLPFPVFALGKHGGVRGVVPPYHCKSYPCRLSRCYLTRDATPAARRRGRSACCGPFSFPTRYDARLSP
jgi:hypothetical protein